MEKAGSVIFEQKDFPHIALDDAVPYAHSGRLLPLCNLKFQGSCQGVFLVPGENGRHFWETPMKIAGCASCVFHRENCLSRKCKN